LFSSPDFFADLHGAAGEDCVICIRRLDSRLLFYFHLKLMADFMDVTPKR
jgi:hypothetical protein